MRQPKEDVWANSIFGFSVTYDENVMEEPHMHDAKDEYLFFTGADLMDPFKSFDAEISIMLGEDPDHMEEYTITAPSVVRIPPNFWHCPVNFKRVGGKLHAHVPRRHLQPDIPAVYQGRRHGHLRIRRRRPGPLPL